MQASIHLPPIPELRRVTQSLAMLDAILSPEWEHRYYSFDGGWGPGEEMASMRNGSGDEWFLLFDAAGAAIKGCAHALSEGPSLPSNIQAQVPADFASFLAEPAFSMQYATFCYWRKAGDAFWSKVSGGPGEDGSAGLLALLVSGPAAYKAWAKDYFEVPIPLDAVAALFAHQPLDLPTIRALNPEADVDAAFAQAREIGFPCGAP